MGGGTTKVLPAVRDKPPAICLWQNAGTTPSFLIPIHFLVYILHLEARWSPGTRYSNADSGCGTMNLEPQSRQCCGHQAGPLQSFGWESLSVPRCGPRRRFGTPVVVALLSRDGSTRKAGSASRAQMNSRLLGHVLRLQIAV